MVNHMRHTHSQTGTRRSHDFLKSKHISMCKDCGAPKLNHTMCANCGKYKSRTVVDVYAKLAEKEKKAKAVEKASK